jgi:hypothetical protein
MRMTLLSLAAAAALVGCAESGPAPTTATTGPGSPPLQQRVFEQPHSPNASAGVPTITGSNAQGRPNIERSGAAPGDVGGTNSAPRPVGSRDGKGS